MADVFTHELTNHRSLEQVCDEMRAKYEKRPTQILARRIEWLQSEIAIRRGGHKPTVFRQVLPEIPATVAASLRRARFSIQLMQC